MVYNDYIVNGNSYVKPEDINEYFKGMVEYRDSSHTIHTHTIHDRHTPTHTFLVFLHISINGSAFFMCELRLCLSRSTRRLLSFRVVWYRCFDCVSWISRSLMVLPLYVKLSRSRCVAGYIRVRVADKLDTGQGEID